MKVRLLTAAVSLTLAVSCVYPAVNLYADEAVPDKDALIIEESVEDTVDGKTVETVDETSIEQVIAEEAGPETETAARTENPETEAAADEPAEKSVILDQKTKTGTESGKKNVQPVRKRIDGRLYLVYPDGTHYTGWFVYSSGKKAYADPENDGALATGVKIIGKKGYLFTGYGNLFVQDKPTVKKRDGKYYYVLESGRLASGWKQVENGRMCFYNTTFAAKTGLGKVKSRYYLFNKKGLLVTNEGLHYLNGSLYYTENNGAAATGWKTVNGCRYYFSRTTCRAYTGIRKVGSKAYYFSDEGVVQGQKGVCVINGQKYWCASDLSLRSGWRNSGGTTMYFSRKSFQCAVGTVTIDKKQYSFDENGLLITGPRRSLENGNMYYYDPTGNLYRNTWIVYNGEKIYVDGNGIGLADLSDQIGGPYTLYVDRTNCVVTAYSGGTPVRSMLTSVGTPGNSTPYGTFSIRAKYPLKELMGPSWGQYACNVDGWAYGGIYFHSVATGSPSDPWHSVPVDEYNKLGVPASHGCIRLCVRDAKWIYDHCDIGTTVVIGDNFAMPFGRPFLTKISTPVDPTDPAV